MNDAALGFGSRVLQAFTARGLQLLDLALDMDKALALALDLEPHALRLSQSS